MSELNHIFYIKRANEVAKNARKHGNTPFGAILVDDMGNILLEQENIEITTKDCTAHAETALMRRASQLYGKDFLAKCTLYTTFEPCAMCSGAMYWGNVGCVVYGLTEKQLLGQTGDDSQNPTFDLPCREIFKKGQKDIKVIGPFLELSSEILETHKGYWKPSSL